MFWCQIKGDGSLDVKPLNWESLTSGYTYSSNNEDIAIAYDTYESDYSCGHEIYGFSSGSVKVVKIDDKGRVNLTIKGVSDEEKSQFN